jgi:hypothetical protein
MAKIRQSNIDPSVVSGQTEFTDVPAGGDFVLFYDQSAGTLKKVSRDKFLGAPSVSSVSPTNLTSGDGTGNYTIVITGTDFNTGVTAKLLTSGGSEVDFDSVTRDSSTQITGVIAKSSLSNANEPYGVIVTNTNGTSNSLTGQINIDAQPVFTTASGSLGAFSQGSSESVSVNATDPESTGNVTFEVQSGALPPGMTLTNTAVDGGTAVISGTTPSPGSSTTYNFVLRAVDAASNTSSRAFSISVTQPTSESFTSSGTFSVPAYVSVIDLLVVAGGGGGGAGSCAAAPGGGGGGGGSGGLVFIPSYPVTGGGTVTVTVGCGGAEAPYTGGAGTSGSDSVFGSPGDPGLGCGTVITAKGGGGGALGAGCGGVSGGSGGGGPGEGNTCQGGSATQPTQPDQSGAYGFGNDGGGGNPAGQYGGGGGGGAGAAGSSSTPCLPQFGRGADGGIGKAYTIGDGTTPLYYAGGGGGAAGYTGQTNPNPFEDGYNLPGGNGGQGGGGVGARYNCRTGVYQQPGGDGQANKGGGAGGGGRGSCSQPMSYAGTGGKGVVIVRY